GSALSERTAKIGIGSETVNEPPALGDSRSLFFDGCGGENRACPGGVLGDLCFQRLEACELLLRADEIDERDPQMPSTEGRGRVATRPSVSQNRPRSAEAACGWPAFKSSRIWVEE